MVLCRDCLLGGGFHFFRDKSVEAVGVGNVQSWLIITDVHNYCNDNVNRCEEPIPKPALPFALRQFYDPI